MAFPYLETAVSFALVMLVASLMVNVVVRVLYTIRGQRAEGVGDMLLQLHRGFCTERGIALRGTQRDLAETAFLNDVLGSPILHDGQRFLAADAVYEKAMIPADAAWKALGLPPTATDADKQAKLDNPVTAKAAAAAQKLEDAAAAARAAYLRADIDTISRGDLLAIIRSYSIDTGVDDGRMLPTTWFAGVTPTSLPPTRAQQANFAYHALPANANAVNARDFHDYCARWFPTVEASASAQFGTEQRGVARSVAGLAVVLLNLDAIHLAYDLYRNRAVSDSLSARVDEVLALSKQIANDKPDAPNSLTQASQEMQKAAAILTVEQVPIGWNDSFIAKRWCAYHHDCDDPTIAVPTKGALTLDLALWALGLLVSWMLLSLGAPFWVGAIEKITGLANLVSGNESDNQKGEEQAWNAEGSSLAASYNPAASNVGIPAQLAPAPAAPAPTAPAPAAPAAPAPAPAPPPTEPTDG